MAEAEIGRVADEARAALAASRPHHRPPAWADPRPASKSCSSSTASTHRAAAFAAAEFLMDYLKTHAPFWKKEVLAEGFEGGWVGAKEEDEDALTRW